LFKNDDGITVSRYGLSGPPRLCDYLDNGQNGCSTYADCISGLCQDGVCLAGKDGDRCVANQQCESTVCSVDGKCISPSALDPFGAGEACSRNEQCLSGNCYYGSVDRPSILNPGETVSYDDSFCSAGVLGDPCRGGSDCRSGACSDQGQCVGKPIPNTCVLARANTPCSRDDQCFSGKCGVTPCNLDPRDCPTDVVCQAIPGGVCRDYQDCGFGADCTDEKAYKGRALAFCNKDSDCLSPFTCGKG
ncbi:hypothetical protein V8E36_008801, partial [Tilletia maclaganii]